MNTVAILVLLAVFVIASCATTKGDGTGNILPHAAPVARVEKAGEGVFGVVVGQESGTVVAGWLHKKVDIWVADRRDQTDTWMLIEYRKLMTMEQLAKLSDQEKKEIRSWRRVSVADLPSPIKNISPLLLESITNIFQYSSGRLDIILSDGSESAARRLVDAIKLSTTRQGR